jgi:hypothetical protein
MAVPLADSDRARSCRVRIGLSSSSKTVAEDNARDLLALPRSPSSEKTVAADTRTLLRLLPRPRDFLKADTGILGTGGASVGLLLGGKKLVAREYRLEVARGRVWYGDCSSCRYHAAGSSWLGVMIMVGVSGNGSLGVVVSDASISVDTLEETDFGLGGGRGILSSIDIPMKIGRSDGERSVEGRGCTGARPLPAATGAAPFDPLAIV